MVRSKGENASGVRPIWRLAVAVVIAVVCSGWADRAMAIGDPRNNPTITTMLRTSGNANSTLAASPPLPMLYQHKGDYKVTLQPYYFINGKLNDTSESSSFFSRRAGSFEGAGGGGGISYGLSDKWGVHLFILGNSLTGDFSTTNALLVGETRGTSISTIVASPMLTYQFFGEKDGGFTMPVFFGPLVTHRSLEARVVESNNGVVKQDFDMKGSATSLGLIAGMQMGIPLGESFMLNPFLMLGVPFDHTVDTKASNIRTNIADPYVTTLSDVSQGAVVDQGTVFGTLGMNLIYRPWGLAFNLTAPFVTSPIFGGEQKGFKMTTFTMSYSFGSYVK